MVAESWTKLSEQLGIDVCTLDAYRLMLVRGATDPCGLGCALGLDDEATSRVWTELSAHELIQPSWDLPGCWRAVHPGIALERLIEQRANALTQAAREVELARHDVTLLVEQCVARPLTRVDDFELLEGFDGIRARMESLAETCEGEVLSFLPGGPQTPESLAASEPLDRGALSRGVRMRTVYLESARRHPPTNQYVRRLGALGAESRTVARLPLKLVVVDRRCAVLPHSPPEDGTAILVRQRGLVGALCELFDNVWRGARPFGGAAEPRNGSRDSQQVELVRLLGQGWKDESIARSLGVSVRTARRMIATVMEEVGATSRFQAGVHAARRGWL